MLRRTLVRATRQRIQTVTHNFSQSQAAEREESRFSLPTCERCCIDVQRPSAAGQALTNRDAARLFPPSVIGHGPAA